MNIEEEFLKEVVPDKQRPTRKVVINCKRKGNSFERTVAKILSERFNLVFARTVSSGAYTGGQNVKNADALTEEQKLIYTGDIRCPVNFVFTVECKNYKSLDFYDLFNTSSVIYSWYRQSESDSKLLNKKPLLIVKTNNHKPIAFVDVKYLLEKKVDTSKVVFTHKGKAVFWLDDLLKFSDDFFFTS